METVWLLHHVHEWDDGHEDVKLIGVFPTEGEARQALVSVKDKPGFCDLPEGFCVSEQTLDLIGWGDGYITLQTGASEKGS